MIIENINNINKMLCVGESDPTFCFFSVMFWALSVPIIIGSTYVIILKGITFIRNTKRKFIKNIK